MLLRSHAPSPCIFQGNFPRGPCLAGPSSRATESLGFSSCFPGIEGRAGRGSALSPSALPRFCSLPTPFLLCFDLCLPCRLHPTTGFQGSIRLIWVPGVCCPMKGEQVRGCFPSQHRGSTQDGGLDSQSWLGWSFSRGRKPCLAFPLVSPSFLSSSWREFQARCVVSLLFVRHCLVPVQAGSVFSFSPPHIRAPRPRKLLMVTALPALPETAGLTALHSFSPLHLFPLEDTKAG